MSDPQTAEEALRALLQSYGALEWMKLVTLTKLEQELQDWHRAWPEGKQWCKHLRLTPNIGRNAWQYVPNFSVLTETWDRCPVKGCGAERPEAQAHE